MSTAASSSKPTDANKGPEQKKDEDSTMHIGVLEEDDEFEEFAAADWDDSQTDLAQLGSSDQHGGDKLWEDNWDDDDIEDDFSVQLRHELEKTGKAPAEAMEH